MSRQCLDMGSKEAEGTSTKVGLGGTERELTEPSLQSQR